MKSFQSVIIAALAVSAAAINEPVASPTAAVERELASYERQLGTDVTGTPTETPPRPTGGVSTIILSHVAAAAAAAAIIILERELRGAFMAGRVQRVWWRSGWT